MAQYLGKLQCVDVTTKDKGVELTFLKDASVRIVKLNRQKYDEAGKKYVNDPEQEERYAKNIKEYLGVEPEDIAEVLDKEFDVWETENYCALWEPKELKKFDESWIGQILTAEITAVQEFEAKAQIVLQFEGEEYGSNINYGSYIPSLKKSLVDPQKKSNQMKKFKDKFNVEFEDRDTLVGTDVMIEVKKNPMDSTGKNPTYIEVKALPKKRA